MIPTSAPAPDPVPAPDPAPDPAGWLRRVLPRLVAAFAVLECGVVLVEAQEQVRAGTLEAAYLAPWSGQAPLADAGDDCRDARLTGWRARPYMASLLSRALREFRSVQPPATVPEGSLRALVTLVCLAERSPFAMTVPIQTFVLSLRGDVMLVPANEPYRARFASFGSGWDVRVADYLARAPGRTDVVIPYLVWLDRQGHFAALFAETDRMLARDPNDPVALWYSGAALTRQPGLMAEGFLRMQRALDTGIERLINVAPALRQQVVSGPDHGG